jgi:hypothetical protein
MTAKSVALVAAVLVLGWLALTGADTYIRIMRPGRPA